MSSVNVTIRVDKLWDVITLIVNGQPLPQKCLDHALTIILENIKI